jgi:hypothetical protein
MHILITVLRQFQVPHPKLDGILLSSRSRRSWSVATRSLAFHLASVKCEGKLIFVFSQDSAKNRECRRVLLSFALRHYRGVIIHYAPQC